jgi:hypothetical protein
MSIPSTAFEGLHNTKEVDQHLGGQRLLRRGRGAIAPRLGNAYGAEGPALADVEPAPAVPALEQDRQALAC